MIITTSFKKKSDNAMRNGNTSCYYVEGASCIIQLKNQHVKLLCCLMYAFFLNDNENLLSTGVKYFKAE